MAMQKRFKVGFSNVFPNGAFLKGSVEPVLDFNAEKRADGSRPQQVDPETGLLVWSVTVLDADEEASKRETAVTVKFFAKVQPVPPENKTPFPWTPVEFTGLTALPWIEETSMGRGRISWSFRAESMTAPGQSSQSGASSGQAKGAA
ncbi:plasmid replication, integration and excision activator [Terrabacter sp. AAH1]